MKLRSKRHHDETNIIDWETLNAVNKEFNVVFNDEEPVFAADHSSLFEDSDDSWATEDLRAALLLV